MDIAGTEARISLAITELALFATGVALATAIGSWSALALFCRVSFEARLKGIDWADCRKASI